jgi:hypothetical protein
LTALTSRNPAWTTAPPSAYDIVTAWYPEDGQEDPGPKLRPCLVLAVLQGKTSGNFACRIAFGTKELKIIKRGELDLIIQNAAHVQQMGLARATRFDLDCIATLLWDPKFFDCWHGYQSPVIGSLTEHYIREYAWIMMKRQSV